MAGSTGSQSATSSGLVFSRSHFEQVNQEKVRFNFDFAYAQYRAIDNFLSLITNIQRAIVNHPESVLLPSGLVVDVYTSGGSAALSLELKNLDTVRATSTALPELGFRTEINLLKQQVGA